MKTETRLHNIPANIEVVVNVHAAQTTTSEQRIHLGVITCSKRKLITTSNFLLGFCCSLMLFTLRHTDSCRLVDLLLVAVF